MTTREHIVELGRTDEGSWACWSTVSPFFYFEDKTREGVLGLANRGLHFYLADAERMVPSEAGRAVKPTLTRVRKRESINLEDCFAA